MEMEQNNRRRKRTDSTDETLSQIAHLKRRIDAEASRRDNDGPSVSAGEKTNDAMQLEDHVVASSWVSPLCQNCQMIFKQWHRFLQENTFGTSHYGDISDVEMSAADGCSLCTQFVHADQIHIDRNGPNVSLKRQKFYGNSSVVMRSPGEGSGSIEHTYRLFLNLPGRGGCVSMVPVITADENHLTKSLGVMRQSNTKDSLQACKEWLAGCLQGHNLCLNSRPHFVPTRLVCLKDDYPCLVTLNELESVREYATLSHCWGSSTFLSLKKGNLVTFRKRIPLEALSKTFLDAIIVCKELKINYIWIDSLCIIQDDSDDWVKEAGLMTKVYGGSHLNIAASGASDGKAGLFFERNPSWFCRVKVIMLGEEKLFDIVPFAMYEGSINWQPLSRRGWALQERLLPTRTILFTTTQVFWECYGNIACERFPNTYPRELSASTRKEPVYKLEWRDIVKVYTQSKLTYASDKLVAISGLAREIQFYTKNEYIAGMWLHNLEIQLCWTVLENFESPNLLSNSPCKVPSWSWASIDAQIDVLQSPTQMEDTAEIYIKVQHLRRDLNESVFGQTCLAQLSVSCSCMFLVEIDGLRGFEVGKMQAWPSVMIGNKLLSKVYMTLSHGIGLDSGQIYFLPVFSIDTLTNVSIGTLRGLILKSCGTTAGYFRRVGSFHELYPPGDGSQKGNQIRTMCTQAKYHAGDEIYTRVYKDEDGMTRKLIMIV